MKSKALLMNNMSIERISQVGSINSVNLQLGKSVANLNYVPGSAINTVERVVSAFPQPAKRPGTTAKAPPKKEGEVADKSKTLSQMPLVKLPANETNEGALKSTLSWNNFQQISKKFSIGTLTTSKYNEKVQVFDQMNEKIREYSSILPQSNFFGQTPDPQKDPYDRRKVKQLNDISFEEEESEEEFEDIKNLKRLPKTVLTEENLKNFLGAETEKVNLEHHYWLKDTFLDKIGRMAPNLRELSLRRLKISNRAFTEIVLHLNKLERIDVSDCLLIQASAMKITLDNNKTLTQIQAANIPNAITNDNI